MTADTLKELEAATFAGRLAPLPAILQEDDQMDAALADDREQFTHTLAPTPEEQAAGVQSLDLLLYYQRDVVRRLAELEALFGGGDGDASLADVRRKQHRQQVMTLIRDDLRTQWEADSAGQEKPPAWKEPSESALERMANSDERHVRFVNALEAQRAQWVRLRWARRELEIRIAERDRVLAGGRRG